MRAARRAGWPLGPGSARRLLRGGPPPHGRRRARGWEAAHPRALVAGHARRRPAPHAGVRRADGRLARDRKSTRLNSSHQIISYAVFCLKKKKLYKQLKRYTMILYHKLINQNRYNVINVS